MSDVNKKTYTFDVTNADQKFNVLLKDRQIKLSNDHKLLKPEEIKDQKYYKYHNTFGHLMNECVRFRDLIQKALLDRRLKFSQRMT